MPVIIGLIVQHVVAAQNRLAEHLERVGPAGRSERAQSTAEYALVMVGVGALAVFVFRWLQTSGLIERLFGAVIEQLMPK